jgi:hypothetical protein
MKKTYFLVTAAIISLAFAGSLGFGKEKSTDTKTTSGKKFDMTGTVTKYEVGICMQLGIKYDLHPATGAAVHLMPVNKHDINVLEDATKSHAPVRVEGTEESGVECQYVKVTKATPVAEKK